MREEVWKSKEGRLFMVRCPKCHMENWLPAVATGHCAWCGYKATEKDLKTKKELKNVKMRNRNRTLR